MLFELPWDVTFKHALELLRVTESVLHASTCMREWNISLSHV